MNRPSNAFYRLVIRAFNLELYSIFIYLFIFEHQFQLISICLQQSISEISIMKQLCVGHFASVELCSIYHPTIIVFWRILNISEEDAWIWPMVTRNYFRNWWQRLKDTKRALSHYKNIKKGTPDLTFPYVHSLFTIVLIKQIFGKK